MELTPTSRAAAVAALREELTRGRVPRHVVEKIVVLLEQGNPSRWRHLRLLDLADGSVYVVFDATPYATRHGRSLYDWIASRLRRDGGGAKS